MMSSRGKRTKRRASAKGASGKAPSRASNRVKSAFVSEKEGKRSLVFRRSVSRGQKTDQKTIFSLPDLVRDIAATIFEPLLVLDHNLRVVLANRSFYKTFQVKRKETEGELFYRIGDRQWDIPELKEKLEEILQKQTSFEDLELKQKLPRIGERTILVNARIISGQGEKPEFVLLAIRDVTESRKAKESNERFSSFPTVSPTPVIETDIAGRILYTNPAAKRLFPDLSNMGSKHPFLVQLSSAVNELKSGKKEWVLRRVEVEGAWYGQTIFMVEGGSRIRIYSTDITENRRTQQALKESENKYRIVADNTYDWEFWLSPEGEYLYVSPSCKRITGHDPEEFLKDPDLRRHIIHPDDRLCFDEHVMDVEQKRVGEVEFRIIRPDGAIRWIHHACQPVFDSEGNYLGPRGSNRDITERKHKEEELRQLNRVLKALSDSNQAMMHATSESGYLKEVCDFIIKDCGYLMVWIGFAENDENKTVRPAAQAGFDKGYLETANITWSDTERGHGPTGTAIRTGKPAICRNMLTDPDFKPWRKEALKRGYASSIVLPLTFEGKTFGAINIYSKEPDPFSEEEIKLLTELSNDLAYGIMSIRLRLEREQAEAALAKSEEKYRFLYEEGQSFNIIIGPDQTIKDANKTAMNLLGYEKDEVVGKPALEFIPDEEKERVKGILAETFSGGTDEEYEIPVLAKDGSVHVILFSPGQATLMEGESIAGIVVTGIDITERKRAEEKLREAKDELEMQVEERTADLLQTNEWLKEQIEERVRTEQSLRLEQARLDALFRLSQISEAPVSEMAAFTLDQGIALTQSEIGFLGFLSEDETIYTLHAVSKDVVKECNVTGNPMQWHVVGAGIWAEAIRQRKTLFVNDYDQPHLAKKGLPPGHPPVNRFMVVPVFEGKRIVAVAGMGNKSTDYDKSDERQIVLLVGGMWSYVQRNHSREALQEAYGELEQRVQQRTAELSATNVALQKEITERKQAEEALQESEERLNRAEEIAHVGSWELDLLSNHLYWSDEVYRIFGLKPQEFEATYEAFLEAVHPDDRQTVDAVYSSSLREGKDAYEIEHRVVRKADGQIRIVYEKCEHIRDGKGRIVRSVGMVQDITERKKAEEVLKKVTAELKEERDLLNVIKENTNTNLAYLDTHFNLIRVNSAFVRTFGHSEEEFIGKNLLDLLRGKEYEAMFEKARDTGETVEYKAKPLKFKDQHEKEITYCDLTLIPVKDDLDRVQGLEFSLVDVTEIKQAEEKIKALNEILKHQAADLAASNKELEAFSYSVSHDLRAPVRKIEGFSRALLEDYAEAIDEQGQDYLKRLCGAADKMKQLIEDLLNLSHLTRAEMKREETDLSALAQTIAGELQKSQPQRKVEFKIVKKLVAKVDKRLLEIALENLLGNAWKFTSTQPEARIEFTATEKNGEKVYLVRDNGVGFDMTYADRLFIPFQRLHLTDEFPGTGIGLATVKRIIDRHGGRIWAEGGEEKGATFFFTLGYKNVPETNRVLINSLPPGRKVGNGGAE
jgi:PAS domain S-box-containing protein